MKITELRCSHCNSDLMLHEELQNQIIECRFCKSKYRIRKGDTEYDYSVIPFEELLDFQLPPFSNTQAPAYQTNYRVSNQIQNKPKTSNSTKLGIIAISAFILVFFVTFLSIVLINITTTVNTATQTITTDSIEVDSSANRPQNFSKDYLPESSAFQEFISVAFDKRLSNITQEDLQKIKYLKIGYDDFWNEIVFEYSYGDYYDYDDTFYDYMDTVYVDGALTCKLSDVSYFTELTELVVDYVNLNASDLQGLYSLHALTCDLSIPEILQGLPAPKQLWYLCLTGNTETLDGIEKFKNLEELNIESGTLTDISILNKLYYLTYLSLEDCHNIKDFSVMYDLKFLGSLVLDCEGLTDISFVSDMKELSYLSLFNTQINDLKPIEGHEELNYLDLTDNSSITSYDVVSTISHLQTLSIYKSKNIPLPDLSSLKELDSLWLSGVSDLDVLRGLDNLELLVLYDADITNVQAFQYTPFLKKLLIENCTGNIESLAFLKNLEELYWLNISGNTFEFDISDVFQVPGLETLYLDNASFQLDAAKITRQSNLSTLSMTYADILNGREMGEWFLSEGDIFLQNFPSLTSLDLSGNSLTSVDMVLSLENLEYLIVDDNLLTDISCLEGLNNLLAVYCADNQIQNYGNLEEYIWIVE